MDGLRSIVEEHVRAKPRTAELVLILTSVQVAFASAAYAEMPKDKMEIRVLKTVTVAVGGVMELLRLDVGERAEAKPQTGEIAMTIICVQVAYVTVTNAG